MGGDGKFMGQGPFDAMHYLKAAFGGAVCCSVTHGGTTPIDVVKTRMQLDPGKYTSFIGTFKHVHAEGGMGALFTGVMPTFQGYFVQGWFKFGGVEICKTKFAQAMGSEQAAYNNRDAITLGGSACAEFVADIFLCPYEACRIRAVSDPGYANGMVAVGKKMIGEMGVVNGLYAGFGPMLFKQIPYTMAKFAVQQKVAEMWYNSMGTSPDKMSKSGVLGVSLGSGVVAGVAAATISQPADGLLSKVNKKGAGGEGSMMTRLGRIAAETGFVKLCTQGLFARWIHVGTITAGQFAVVDACMMAVGASRFHFHDPSKH
jgi:solute carrier family 25 phosphate transporter 3|mmetsp:Transcript_24626/g.39534  ORF Transcript_24626/g.39534 Transcript_24626/m.39534 type:complete len:316 (-) Transcript_24626:139-1086(-)